MNLYFAESQALSSTTLWLAIFPLSYLIHFAEEYWGGEGYPAYLLRLRGVHLSTRRFIVLQAAGFGLLIAAGLVSSLLRFPEFMLAILGAVVLSNGISHSFTAWRDGRYGPGLVVSTLFWIPLGAVTLFLMLGRLSNGRLAVAAMIGFAINGAVALITMRGGRLARQT